MEKVYIVKYGFPSGSIDFHIIFYREVVNLTKLLNDRFMLIGRLTKGPFIPFLQCS